jgi:hypothetical protein
MKTKDLKFWKTIEGGKKLHYIFLQEGIFFVLTDMDKGFRGNFHAISLEEVDSVRNQFCSNLIPKTFQCSRIFKFISEVKGKENNNTKKTEMEESFLIDRLTRIAYILTGMNLLKIDKYAGSVFFTKNINLHKSIVNIENNEGELKSNDLANKNPKYKPIKIETDPSKTLKLRKTEKLLRRCPYCNIDVNTNKYEKHIKLRCPKRPKN